MKQEQTIRKLADYLLLNACSVEAPGLYEGKAGLSLVLFETAQYFQEEEIENKAFKLLQEALIDKNKNCHFENGLSGIGYVLLYLIENKFVDADFDEIFKDKYEEIISSFGNIEKDPLRLVNSLQVIYFLTKVRNLKHEDSRPGDIMKKIFEGLELFLSVQLNDFPDIRYLNNKMAVLRVYTIYLQLIDYSGYRQFSRLLLEDYSGLYRTGRIVSSLAIGYYLNRITNKYDINGYEDITEDNLRSGIKNIYADALSLKERVDFARLVSVNKNKEWLHNNFSSSQEDCREEELICSLLATKDEGIPPIGYGAGLARLLLFYVNPQTELL